VSRPTLLAPSLLAGNHAALAESVALVAQSGLTWLHLDIMDGHFVPNLTFGPQILAALRPRFPGLFFDTHLMLDNPGDHVEAFARAGADLISIHIEPVPEPTALLRRIRALGPRGGLVLNPDTPAAAVEPFLGEVDLVLVMTVQPGFGGQAFREAMLPKIRQIDTWRRERDLDFHLEVDGGVDLRTGPLCRQAGAEVLVAGTAFYQAPDPAAFARTVATW
jgi:ribulose-phosphate 3-epimerase